MLYAALSLQPISFVVINLIHGYTAGLHKDIRTLWQLLLPQCSITVMNFLTVW